MSRSRLNRIAILKTRAAFLKVRIAERGYDIPATEYDRKEMQALEWALPVLMGHVEANRMLHEQLRDDKTDG